MRRLLLPVLAALGVLAAGQANAQKSDWELEQDERQSAEREVTLPPAPGGGLVEFYVSAASSFRFFIDPQSLAVDGNVVRYTLVARSPSGAQNASYEGIRCGRAGLYRVYAYGSGAAWTKSTLAEWRPIEPRDVQRWHNELRDQYFCPNGAPIHSAAEALDALRRGGHPAVSRSNYSR